MVFVVSCEINNFKNKSWIIKISNVYKWFFFFHSYNSSIQLRDAHGMAVPHDTNPPGPERPRSRADLRRDDILDGFHHLLPPDILWNLRWGFGWSVGTEDYDSADIINACRKLNNSQLMILQTAQSESLLDSRMTWMKIHCCTPDINLTA